MSEPVPALIQAASGAKCSAASQSSRWARLDDLPPYRYNLSYKCNRGSKARNANGVRISQPGGRCSVDTHQRPLAVAFRRPALGPLAVARSGRTGGFHASIRAFRLGPPAPRSAGRPAGLAAVGGFAVAIRGPLVGRTLPITGETTHVASQHTVARGYPRSAPIDHRRGHRSHRALAALHRT